jgi:NADH-quinone oxidoreductase subunit J
MTDLIFWTFASIAIIAALMVIVAKNPVRAVLSLIVTFLATAATWLTLDAEFLGITLVLVYVGAVMVLFMFVVMLLDVNYAALRAKFTHMVGLGVLLATALLVNVACVFITSGAPSPANPAQLAYGPGASNTNMLGELIFTRYLLQFEIAGVILLVAIIAAISLIYRGPRTRKVQNISEQVKVTAAMRVRLVDGN